MVRHRVVDQSGGTVSVGQYVSIGGESGSGFGVYNLTGGNANFCLANKWSTNVGVQGSGTGVVNISGTGQLTTISLLLGTYGNATGICNLGAVNSVNDTSVLSVENIGRYTSTAKGYLNFHGGTLQANAASSNFLGNTNAITATYVYGEGAKFDTQSFDVTIATPLSAPTGRGVTSIPVVDGGSGYIGAPAVKITGGSGTGATAIAVMNGDKVDHLVITNPGTGYSYSNPPTITLLGGGATTAATLGTAVRTTNTSGGFTKLGSGNLRFTAANTYTGTTTVQEGRLILGTGHRSRRPAT